MSSIAADKFGAVGKESKLDNVSLEQTFKRIPIIKYRYGGYFPSVCVPTFDNDSFAIIKTLLSNLRGEYWIKIANSRHKLSLAESLGSLRFLN